MPDISHLLQGLGLGPGSAVLGGLGGGIVPQELPTTTTSTTTTTSAPQTPPGFGVESALGDTASLHYFGAAPGLAPSMGAAATIAAATPLTSAPESSPITASRGLTGRSFVNRQGELPRYDPVHDMEGMEDLGLVLYRCRDENDDAEYLLRLTAETLADLQAKNSKKLRHLQVY